MIRALVLIALATPAQAFEIDYAQVFAANPDAIIRIGASTRRVDLPGPVHVVETTGSDGSLSYYGYDESPFGPPACMLNVIIDLTVAAETCDGLLSPDKAEALAENRSRLATFVAANAVPVVSDVDQALRDRIDTRRTHLSRIGIACPNRAYGATRLMPMVDMLASPRTTQVIAAMTAVPRLPVPNPCAEQ